MERNILKTIVAYFLLGCLFAPIACSYASEITFHGRVVDFETKRPIAGAVVVAIWYEARATVAGESTRLKDVREALTDSNGNWHIKGPKGRMNDSIPGGSFITGIHYTREPEFIVYKPGYCSWPNGFTIEACKNRIRPGETKDALAGKDIELGKLTNKEDRLKAIRIGPVEELGKEELFRSKQKELMRLINEESRYLGLAEYGLQGGDHAKK